ncbi:hypothetical protein EYF80_022463 [Liparis tanakae]|uniref:Uncharacterized protein n=1 Tax=Liparis tanakae TaxID=230148 RepID=A0A4Z2HNC6_9TELE|nr:hypothetical protein EYF80_022463 [Liparis tanakae]
MSNGFRIRFLFRTGPSSATAFLLGRLVLGAVLVHVLRSLCDNTGHRTTHSDRSCPCNHADSRPEKRTNEERGSSSTVTSSVCARGDGRVGGNTQSLQDELDRLCARNAPRLFMSDGFLSSATRPGEEILFLTLWSVGMKDTGVETLLYGFAVRLQLN